MAAQVVASRAVLSSTELVSRHRFPSSFVTTPPSDAIPRYRKRHYVTQSKDVPLLGHDSQTGVQHSHNTRAHRVKVEFGNFQCPDNKLVFFRRNWKCTGK
jgi:hypothetical protein